MRCPRIWGHLTGAMLALATPAHADQIDRARIAGIAGSERLRLFSYGKLLETGHAPRWAAVQMKGDMVRQGFYADPGTNRLIATDVWVGPILSYDGNINGGVLQDSFIVNGLVFEADPGVRAKAGVVVGLSGGAVARLALANGRYVEGRVQGEAVWSPEHQIGRSTVQLGLCSRNHVTGWTFVDLCHSASAVERELTASRPQETTLALTGIFRTADAYHQLTAEVAEAHYDTGRQPSVTLSWGAVWDHAATDVSLTRAAPIDGDTALNTRISAEVDWLWRDRAVGVGLWHQLADGGAFLGTPRSDRSTGITLSYQINSRVTVQIAYLVNRSSVEFFDYEQFSVNARFDALRW